MVAYGIWDAGERFESYILYQLKRVSINSGKPVTLRPARGNSDCVRQRHAVRPEKFLFLKNFGYRQKTQEQCKLLAFGIENL